MRSNFFLWYTNNLCSASESFAIIYIYARNRIPKNLVFLFMTVFKRQNCLFTIDKKLFAYASSEPIVLKGKCTKTQQQLLSWRPLHLPSTDHMNVEVIDTLRSIGAIINHHAESFI